jgi:hypothetical protein
MDYKEIFWMACDSTEQLRAEYGPFHTRAEAEAEARKLGFCYLLRYEHLLDENEEIQEVRCIFIELPGALVAEGSSVAAEVRSHFRLLLGVRWLRPDRQTRSAYHRWDAPV